LASALSLVCALAACGGGRAAANPFDPSSVSGGTGAEEPIRIEVQNLAFNEAAIWAIRQGQRVRVGRVGGKSEDEFQIMWNTAFPISFYVDTTGGRTCRTQQVSVDRNARVWLTIPSNIGMQACRIGRR
jgi:hypothetical protein